MLNARNCTVLGINRTIKYSWVLSMKKKGGGQKRGEGEILIFMGTGV